MVPWAHVSLRSNRHLNWFNRFCKAHKCDQQTDTQTQITQSVAVMRPNYTRISSACQLSVFSFFVTPSTPGKKVKFSHTRYRALDPELIPVYRQSARRWLEANHLAVGCHYFPPGLRLPSQPKIITAHRPVPNYTAWWQRHMRVSSLPEAVTWKQNGWDLNPRPLGSRANAVPLSHTGHLDSC